MSAYERMTVVELRALANTREIPFTTKMRKPDLIALHTGFDNFQKPEITWIDSTDKSASEVFDVSDWPVIGAIDVMTSQPTPKRHGALKLHPHQMRLNYARQRTHNPHLTLVEAFNVKLTPKQHRMISRRNGLIACGKLSEVDFKELSA